MNDPLVSVIVLTYDHSPFIRECLDSILGQDIDFRYEVLVGDDASADGTSEIVRWYAEKYPDVIHAFIREKNLGATRNLYDLFTRARGRYIASCEGDDYWTDPLKLRKQVGFLEGHPEYSGCTHGCRIVDEDGKPAADQRLRWVCKKETFTLKDFRGIYLPGQPATLVHRNFFLDTSHDYSIIYKANQMIADRTVAAILAAQGSIRRFPDVMSCYRVRKKNEDSATARAFRNNPDVNRMQYEYTCALERYLQEEFGLRVRFSYFKYTQRIKGWIRRSIQMITGSGRRK